MAEGELPAGKAGERRARRSTGTSERIPTVCVMALSLEDVPEREAYLLQLDEGPPIEFDAQLVSDTEPLQLIVP